MDKGRLRGRSDVWEVGRLCQESGEFREGGIAPEGEAFVDNVLSSPVSAYSRLAAAVDLVFSFVGESSPVKCCMVSSMISSLLKALGVD